MEHFLDIDGYRIKVRYGQFKAMWSRVFAAKHSDIFQHFLLLEYKFADSTPSIIKHFSKL